jgi:myo-inositol 2-dehydrogenase/D-chiro-inositol 1-dehydrogenase/scyllo-inositol 2-dehydrogenase (NAD+)
VKKVRFCLFGAGRAGLIHAINLAGRIPKAELAALCDANEQTLHRAGQELGVGSLYTDYKEAVLRSNADAVVIVTPTFLHRDIACFAASHGKHVFLEKPMALTISECQEIQASVTGAGVKLQIGFMRRFDEGFMQAKAILDSGELGAIMIVKSTGRGPGGPGEWMYDLRKSNGVIAEVNSHDIDSLFWFTGKRAHRIYAQAHNFKSPAAKAQWPDFYDNVVATFTFEEGTMGVIDGTCPAHYGYDARVEILCEKGLLQVGYMQQPGTVKVTVDGQVIGHAVKSWRTLFKEAYLKEMEHFVECIETDRPPLVTGQDGLRAVEAVVIVNQSIRLGQAVEANGGKNL